MRLFLSVVSIILTMFTGSVFASVVVVDKAMQLAETGVVTKDANGDDQTTVVDVNGNLKVRPPVDKDGKPLDTTNNNSNPNNAGDSISVPEQPQSDN